MLVDQVRSALHALPVYLINVQQVEGSDLSLNVYRFLLHSWMPFPLSRVACAAPVPAASLVVGTASSAHTVIFARRGEPYVVTIATSSASRPRPISTRPIRGSLLRGSNVHQRPARYTSIQAQKSIGASGGGTPI